MKAKFTIALLILGVFVFLGAIFRWQKQEIPVGRRSFTLTSVTYRIENNGPKIIDSYTTKFVRNGGRWKEIMVNADTQAVRTTLAKDGNTYEVKNDKQEWVSQATTEQEANEQVWTLESIRSNPEIVRTEQIFGVTAYVSHHQVNSETWGEFWYAPETGEVPLKIHTSSTGGRMQRIVEPIALTFGDVPDTVVEGPNLPVSFERIKQHLAYAEKQGHAESVDRIRRIVEQEEAKLGK